MKYAFVAILFSMAAMLSCTPAQDSANQELDAEVLPNSGSEEYQVGTWTEDWDLALSAAKELHRPILVNFTGSDWCVWCTRLAEEVFTQDEFKQFAKENLVMLKLDFPRNIKQSDELKQQNSMLQRQFSIKGYPTIVFLNEEGKEINRTGYRPGGAAEYVSHIKELLK